MVQARAAVRTGRRKNGQICHTLGEMDPHANGMYSATGSSNLKAGKLQSIMVTFPELCIQVHLIIGIFGQKFKWERMFQCNLHRHEMNRESWGRLDSRDW